MAEYWCNAGLTAALHLSQKKKLHFSLICSFYCLGSEKGLGPESYLAIFHPRASRT